MRARLRAFFSLSAAFFRGLVASHRASLASFLRADLERGAAAAEEEGEPGMGAASAAAAAEGALEEDEEEAGAEAGGRGEDMRERVVTLSFLGVPGERSVRREGTEVDVWQRMDGVWRGPKV